MEDNKNEIIINNRVVKFFSEIKAVKEKTGKYFVVLNSEIETNNLYCLDDNGDFLWQSQKLEEAYPKLEKLMPLEDVFFIAEDISAIDFMGRRYFINEENGKIIGHDFVK